MAAYYASRTVEQEAEDRALSQASLRAVRKRKIDEGVRRALPSNASSDATVRATSLEGVTTEQAASYHLIAPGG